MSRRVRHLAGAMAAAALAVGSGCGGDDEQLDAAELVSRGDEICREGQQSFAEIQEGELANARDAVGQTDELLGVARDELDELRDLNPPEELQQPYDLYLEARERAVDLLQQGRDAAADRDAAGYSKAQQGLADGARERRRLARAVGFQVCSQPREGI
jgi:hypothetical protein